MTQLTGISPFAPKFGLGDVRIADDVDKRVRDSVTAFFNDSKNRAVLESIPDLVTFNLKKSEKTSAQFPYLNGSGHGFELGHFVPLEEGDTAYELSMKAYVHNAGLNLQRRASGSGNIAIGSDTYPITVSGKALTDRATRNPLLDSVLHYMVLLGKAQQAMKAFVSERVDTSDKYKQRA